MDESNLGSERVLHAKGHKPTCACTICRRIQAAVAAGKPPKSVVRAMAHERRLNREKARASHYPRSRRENRMIKNSALISALATQAASGERPNLTLAARIAGLDPSQAVRKLQSDRTISEGILEALSRAGLGAEKLAAALNEGLQAYYVKTATLDGRITDERVYPDFATRHKFVETALKVRGELKQEEQTPPGGLVLLGVKDAPLLPGHQRACQCAECVAMWETEISSALKLSARRAAAFESDQQGRPSSCKK